MDAQADAGGNPVVITAARDHRRLDIFLAEAVEGLSRSRLQQMLAAGQVLDANGKVVVGGAAAAVTAGARFTVLPPAAVAAAPQPQAMQLDILFEDADLIVLDKPAGLVVHPAPGSPDGTLVNALLAHCGANLPGIGGERRPGIVHRLDKDTSGLMVVAKSEAALTRLSADFAARRLERAYVALCWGLPSPTDGVIEASIGRDPRDRKRMAVVARGGRSALTGYRVERSWAGGATLLTCRLATGRTHQIRVHLAHRGHPLVGDPVYLRRVPAVARLFAPAVRAALLDFPRQALHAAVLGFTHPVSGAVLRFERPMPADLAELICALDGAGGAPPAS